MRCSRVYVPGRAAKGDRGVAPNPGGAFVCTPVISVPMGRLIDIPAEGGIGVGGTLTPTWTPLPLPREPPPRPPRCASRVIETESANTATSVNLIASLAMGVLVRSNLHRFDLEFEVCSHLEEHES
jgi:hypothetical protein